MAGRLPPDSLIAENLVGTCERPGDARLPEEFAAAPDDSLTAQALPPFRTLAADELDRVQAARAAPLARWRALPRGETLRLEFPVEAAAPVQT